MRRHVVPLVVIVLALAATVWLPVVNRISLWGSLPSVMVWTAVWVLAITAALAVVEFSGVHDEADARELQEEEQR